MHRLCLLLQQDMMHEAMSRMGFGGAERSPIETGFSDCLVHHVLLEK
ncbi:MAG: hypothetical protein AAFW88_11205 [Pseudomonadota bacterium]